MPRIKVIIKGGQDITVEGVNEAAWRDLNLNWTGVPAKAEVLVLSAPADSTGTKKEIATFKATEVVGFIIDPKD